MAPNWTDEDQGLLHAVFLLDHIQRNDQLLTQPENSPLNLQPGEQNLATTSAIVQVWAPIKVRPADWSYFRFRVKVARDPLMAPFVFLFTLPFNLASRIISYQRATQTQMGWKNLANGPLTVTVTERALVQAGPRGQIRMPWAEITAVDLGYIPAGIKVSWGSQVYSFHPPPVYRMFLFVAFRYLALGDRTTRLGVSEEFMARARSLGKIA